MFIKEFLNSVVVHPFEKRRQLIAKFLALTKELELLALPTYFHEH